MADDSRPVYLWDSPAGRGIACHFLTDRQDKTVSKREIQVGNDVGFVGAVREPPKIMALLEAPLRQESL